MKIYHLSHKEEQGIVKNLKLNKHFTPSKDSQQSHHLDYMIQYERTSMKELPVSSASKRKTKNESFDDGTMAVNLS